MTDILFHMKTVSIHFLYNHLCNFQIHARILVTPSLRLSILSFVSVWHHLIPQQMKKRTGILSFVSQASTIIPTKQAQESPRCILPSSGFSSNNITLQQTQSSRIQPSKLSKIQSMYKFRSMQTADFWCFFYISPSSSKTASMSPL